MSVIVTPFYFRPTGGQHQKGPSKKGSIVVALYNYQGSEHGDMTFVKGDIMEIVDDSDPDWWLAKNLNSGAAGHIPRNYVAFQSSLESQECTSMISLQ